MILALAAAEDLELAQCDIKAAYLQATLPEDDPPRYMDVPEGLPNVDEDGNDIVCRLHKSLYGLSAAGRMWSEELKKHMESQNFKRTHADGGIYVRGKRGDANFMVVFSWVDDLTLMGSKTSIEGFMEALKAAKLETSSSGELRFIINLKITRDRKNKTITLNQEAYINSMVEKFGMADAIPALTPLIPNTQLGELGDDPSTDTPARNPKLYMELVGSLLYASNTCRPDIAFAVSQLARYMTNPRTHHWNAASHVLRYLKGTAHLGITFDGNVKDSLNTLYGFADSDYAGDKDAAKSTSGYIFFLNGGAISWRSKKQSVTAQSTAEAELISASMAAREATHLRLLLSELSYEQGQTTIFEDNQACIKIAENPITSERTKHIKVKYFYVREQVQQGELMLIHVGTASNVADALTKNLNRERMETHRDMMFHM
jgi:hydrogenase maturation factor